MNKEVIKQKIENAFSNFEAAIQQHENINVKRVDGGWSVGEIGDHIVIGTIADFGPTRKTERPYDANAESIRETFLNFALKFPAAPFLHPDAKQYVKAALMADLKRNKAALLAMTDKDDLTETCTHIELPVWGHLTKYEWLVLIENHIIRHTRQIHEFKPAKNKDYWNGLYNKNETGWDIGYPSPAITAYIDQLDHNQYAILIPGCGNSYEAEYLLQKGFTNITLIDVAPLLTQALEEKFRHYINKEVKIITGDFFEHEGQYDLILEQTFLSALHPSIRNKYVQQMHDLLKPGGTLAGVLFNKHFDEGPPYGGNEQEYRQLFGGLFNIMELAPCYNSIERRAGAEVFINLKKIQ